MLHIDDPDGDGTYECPTCKGTGFLPAWLKCDVCHGNVKGKRRVCQVMTKRKLDYTCWGTSRPDGRCRLTNVSKARCRKDEPDFWTEIDCGCKNGKRYRERAKVCSRCKGEGRLDWVQMITSKARNEEE